MKNFRLKVLVVLALLLSLVALPQTPNAATKKMYVHYINVGQGDSIYIKAPNGEDIIIDGGRDGNKVVSYLKRQHVGDIEVMIATHPDADHIGGLDEVLKAYKVKSFYAPKVSNSTQTYANLLRAVKNEGLKAKTATKGVSLPVKGVSAKFVGPVKSYSDLNDNSAVLRVQYGKKSFLFTGDAEFKAETDMIKSKQYLRSDVLKVGHHGAKTSTSTAFLRAVKPAYAVISVGKGNSYGHPTADTLNRLKTAKVKIFRTDKQGTIVANTDGKNLSFNTKPVNTPTTSSTAKASYKLSASLNNTKPKQYSTIYLTVKGLPNGTKYKAVCHYKSTNTTYNGKIGSKLPIKISRAAKGYKVKVDVSASYKGKTYKTQTSFTPR